MNRLIGLLASAALLSSAASAGTASGTSNGIAWKAANKIVGQTSTATLAGGGDPIYFAQQPLKSGVVALIMDYGPDQNGMAQRFICSGSLMSDRMSIVTAGHCVSGGAGTSNPISTTAYFYGGSNPDTVVPFNSAATAVPISRYFVNPLYTGEVIDENDIAILRLVYGAPSFATAYDPYFGGDLTGVDFTVNGYGRRSDTGGSVGSNLGTGRLREGENTYDFALGDPAFGGFFEGFFGTANVTHSFLSDFDNGLDDNDSSCIVFGYCGTGLGAREVNIAGGDSGGPAFVNGQIASVNSYGLSFGLGSGDIDDELNDSFGEFSGYVPLYIHQSFIAAALAVPEPGTWAMLIAGFGLTGAIMRRQRKTIATA